ncbi:MAG: S8 family serine peptidase [Pseudomonadota bacterium]|nr:S8 family serine peptidase [Pseudomonadota bacterium]
MLNKYSSILASATILALSGCSDSDSTASSGRGPDVGGTIAIESRTRIDLDTADDILAGTAVSEVVSLPGGAVAAGYLSSSGGSYSTGTADDFAYYRDEQDQYAASLSAGDSIVIQLFGAPDRFLPGIFPPRLRVEVASGGRPEQQTVTGFGSVILNAVASGADPEPHNITLYAESGAPFRYVIALVNDGNVSAANFRYSEPAFRPGEAVVVMEEPGAGRASPASVFASGVAARSLGKGVWHVRQPSASSGVTTAAAATSGAQATLDWIRDLRTRPGVRHAEPNYLYYAQQTPPPEAGEDLYTRQWNLPLIQLPLAWQLAPRMGRDVGVAVMDTGLFTATPGTAENWHSDLDTNVRLVPGEIMDFVSGELDYDQNPDAGRDQNPADPGDGTPRSSNFHGTHVAGIIAATDNDDGIIGVAPSVDLYPIRVLGRNGEGSLEDLLDAINWASGQPGIDVINLSLGGLGDSTELKKALDGARAKGKLVVAAAGNQGSGEPTYPAAYPNVVGVGAVDRSGRRASYSNVGVSVDAVAPGGDYSSTGGSDLIVSTWGLDDGGDFREAWAGLQGTSMAAPHVSALYALMKSGAEDAGREFGPEAFFTYLVDGQLTATPPNRSEYGYGLIDAVKAVSAAREGNVPGVILAAQPTVLQFTRALTRQTVELVKYSEGDLSVTLTDDDVSATQSWVQAALTPGSGGDSLTVTADPSGLADGQTRRAEVQVVYDDGSGSERTLTIPVIQQTGDSLNDRNAGRHYVLLVSTGDSQETVQQVVVEAEAGQYRFAFNDVSPGKYFLVAGTDTDNNGLICENGEACAEYPVNGRPGPLVFDGASLPELSLSTSFRRPTISALGEPRYGFRGYRIKTASDSAPIKRVRTTD